MRFIVSVHGCFVLFHLVLVRQVPLAGRSSVDVNVKCSDICCCLLRRRCSCPEEGWPPAHGQRSSAVYLQGALPSHFAPFRRQCISVYQCMRCCCLLCSALHCTAPPQFTVILKQNGLGPKANGTVLSSVGVISIAGAQGGTLWTVLWPAPRP